ncbi:hypothetical protein CEY16_09065 [Halalkalibacillus sediminis]|uniref:GGDEF domain-containing protein n=1 Tax=Halalkalibacillus sediminis TaxID=2018042 RepID=A0A2I0QUQ1_9BACI|nr:EAL domain-containing protein [Halalkalibacillus sediminis]PKR78056.1 hypothetical protein CEY16_09065 [Halalkalibacillus sediminis]
MQNEYQIELKQLRQFPLKFIIIYLSIGVVWITSSDYLVEILVDEASTLSFVQSLKGWFYVFFTGALFYYFIFNEKQRTIRFHNQVIKKKEEVRLTDTIIDQIAQGLMITDETGRILKANQYFVKMSGLSVEDIVGERYERLPHFVSARQSYRQIRRELKRNGKWQGEVSTKNLQGEKNPELLSLHEVRDEEGKLKNYFGFIVDLTEIKSKEEALSKAKNHLQSMIDHSPLGIIVCDKKGIIHIWNEQAEKILKVEASRAVGYELTGTVRELLYDTRSNLSSVKGDESVPTQLKQIVTSDGEEKFLQVSYSNLFDPDGSFSGFQVIINDMTSEEAYRRELKYLEEFDLATGLYNFNTLKMIMNETIEKYTKEQHALLVFDIDRFHQINQNYGPSFGDKLISEVGRRIRSLVGDRCSVGRLRGDEFGVFVDITCQEEVRQIIRQVIRHFQEPIVVRNEQLHVTVSTGITLYPEDGLRFEGLYQKGNAALKKAKKEQSHYFFYDDSSEDSLYTYEMENELHRAIKNKEIVVYYQPQFNMKTGELFGFEALARWRHPKKGLVPPNQFIPLAEDTGLIIPMTELIIDQVCQDYVSWQRSEMNVPSVSINISANHFMKESLVEDLLAAKQTYQIPDDALQIEITESIMMDIENGIEALTQLREAGIKISIDDFGTGYSSLRYIRELPIDFIKIDRSFVNRIDQSDENMIDFIIQLSKLSSVQVVAEGVETKEQINYLLSKGCEVGQGFYYFKPMPTEEVFGLKVG